MTNTYNKKDGRRVFNIDISLMPERKAMEYLKNIQKAVRPIVDDAFIAPQEIVIKGIR